MIIFKAEEQKITLLNILTEFDQELKKQHADCTDVKKLEIVQNYQGYKKKLARRKRKWVKFMQWERKLELREETELHNNLEKPVDDNIYTPVQSETMAKKEESKSSWI